MPPVRITSGPNNSPNSKATLKFVANIPGAGYECRLDGSAWKSCSSPKVYKNLQFGDHNFKVRARDQFGNYTNVAQWNWKTTVGKCKLSFIRSRFFVFNSKNVIRLVAKYKAKDQGAVRVKFYKRTAKGKKGKFVAATQTRFKKSPKKFKFFRVAKKRPAKIMKQLRSKKQRRRGFIASITVLNSPNYCKRIFNTNLQLTVYKKNKGQNVWFQKGSFGQH